MICKFVGAFKNAIDIHKGIEIGLDRRGNGSSFEIDIVTEEKRHEYVKRKKERERERREC